MLSGISLAAKKAEKEEDEKSALFSTPCRKSAVQRCQKKRLCPLWEEWGESAPLFSNLSAITKEDLQKRYAKYAGHLFLRYIILTHPMKCTLWINDAAHERILYENMLQGYLNNTLERQLLLPPAKLRLLQSCHW